MSFGRLISLCSCMVLSRQCIPRSSKSTPSKRLYKPPLLISLHLMGELGLLQAARRLAKASTNGVQSMWCKVLPCIHQGLAYGVCICKDSHQKPSPSVSACMSHPCCVQRKGQCGRQLPCQEYRSHTESHESQQCVLRIRQVMSEISGPIHFC